MWLTLKLEIYMLRRLDIVTVESESLTSWQC